jgi:hypothetical protein
MTTLIELGSNNRPRFRNLFDRYPCLHGVVAAVIEGGMGESLRMHKRSLKSPSPRSIFIYSRVTRSM